jgi:hypothetical protein
MPESWPRAHPLDPDTPQEGDMVNIFVVDQNNQPIVFYATGKKEILNAYTLPESTDI